jgi:lysozyme family protein
MAASNYARCLKTTLRYEGGYVNHPKDPGGATNKGVTQAVYDAWRVQHAQPKRSVRSITDEEVAAIYRRKYWDAVKGDDLPVGVDMAVFDFAVNSGVSRAVKYLQQIVGVQADGVMGPKTLAAVKASKSDVAAELNANRLAFMRRLSTWSTFGRGWSARMADISSVVDRMTA